MKIRSLVATTVLAVLGATPFAAQAYGSATAADACIQAFVDAYLPKDRAIRVRQPPVTSSALGIYSRHYTIDLSVRLSRNGNDFIAARCVASASGRVIELATVPPAPGGSEVTARLK